ncbi:hypothetical protein J6590_106564, partial [Homalodisca vitripennis]
SSQTVGSVQQTRVTYPYSFSFVPSQESSQTVGSVHQTRVTYPYSFSFVPSQESSQAVCSVHQTRVTYPHTFSFVPSQEVELDYGERSLQAVCSVHQTRVTYPHSFLFVPSQEVELIMKRECSSSQTVGSVHQRRVTYPHSFSLLLSQDVELVKIKDSAEYLAEADIIKNCLIGIQSSQTVSSVHQTRSSQTVCSVHQKRVTYPHSFSLVLSQEVELDNGEIVLSILRWPKYKCNDQYRAGGISSQAVCSVHQTRVTYPPSFLFVPSQEVELDYEERVLSILRRPKKSITVLLVYRFRKLSALSIRRASLTRTRFHKSCLKKLS